MLQPVIRFFKRFAVLIPGIVVAYLSFYNIYPFIERGTPDVVAFLLTYIVMAYALIPATTRAVRILRPPKHLPVYSVTPDGFASDPINIGIIGTRAQLIHAMERAGWHTADQHTPANLLREVISTILKQPYPNSPMSTLYLFGRRQDLGFEIQIADQFKHRHHVRFWATTFDKDKPLSADSIHWLPHRGRRQESDQQLLWLGAASKDVGIGLIRHNAQLTHMIHPDTDGERDLIVEQLGIDGATLQTTLPITRPYKLTNRVWRGYLQSDGQLKVMALGNLRKLRRV